MKSALIIENDPDTMELLDSIVSGLGLRAVCVGEAIDANLVDTLNPDVILLDHWLDGTYGGDFCRELKSNPFTNRIPVIMLSASYDLKNIAAGAGADAYINKPFELVDLERKIREFVR